MRLSFLLLPMLLAACSIEPVRRTMELSPHAELPAGHAELGQDGMLRVELGEIEPLEEGHAYVAWASTLKGSTYLGPVSAKAALEAMLSELGLDPHDLREVRITIEDASSLPRSAPSAPPVLEAAFSHESAAHFAIPKVDEASLAEASASVRIEDSHIAVTSHGLPVLPSALFYGVWIEFQVAGGATSDPPESHTHHSGTGADAGASSEPSIETVFVGPLNPAGGLDIDLKRLAIEATSMKVCVEADHGVSAASPTCVLHGELIATPGSSEEAPAEHVH